MDAPFVESPRARPGKPPAAPEADLARGDRDWSLIDALRQREPIAAERLVATYGDHAYRVAIRITGNAQDAEEVVQDAFWSVVRNIDSFRGTAAFGSWLCAMSRVCRTGRSARSSGSPSPARRPVSTGRGCFSASNSPNTWPRGRAGLAPT